MSKHSVSFIGSGNLAWHLAPALDNMGYVVREVYSRNPSHAKDLTKRLYQAETKNNLDFSSSSSNIFIIAVADDAIQSIAQELVLPDDAVLVHTSGSQPLSLLGYAATPNIGVFYPLQTFSKNKKIDFQQIPIFIESETKETERELRKMAEAISKNVKSITSNERKALHVAAVFASNFTNHMLTISKDLLEAHHLDFNILKPLISETLNKSLIIGPDQSQTGPAVRGDLEILDKHLEFLKTDESLALIYRYISQHIIERYDVGE
ncbi:MAG TPA: DUF2520 domain-containing protein [Cyclobacteriaceae bacterium]|nr:DUF2520 domain-containing protein [Cyclobacteriaceae bacterium]HRW99115.1 DUF2520 domain-containing protein [Cyclobacteriaceae bacterium]